MPGGVDEGPRGTTMGTSPEGMYGITAELKVHLASIDSVKDRSDSLVARIEKHIQREVEGITASDFLTRIQWVLQRAGLKRVLMVNKNDVNVFVADEKRMSNWEEAFEAAMNEKTRSKGADECWVLVSGSSGDFKFRQDVTFKEKHALAAPPISIVIRAFPAEWGLQPGEGSDGWMNRLKAILSDKDGVKAEEVRVKPKMEKYLLDYQQLLKGSFPVQDISQALSINLSGINVESFKEFYSKEHGS